MADGSPGPELLHPATNPATDNASALNRMDHPIP